MKSAGSAWGATLGALIAYVLATTSRVLPLFVYLPRTGTWHVGNVPGEPGIRWYAWVLWGLLGGLLGALAGRAVRERAPWWTAWGPAAVALIGLAIAERKWFRW